MDVLFRTIETLPDNAAAALLVGQDEGHLLVREDATATEIVAELNRLVRGWAQRDWLYIGQVREVA